MNKIEYWENVYKNKPTIELSWYQTRPDISLAIINKIELKSTDYIIDVGGGASTLADSLVEARFKNITVLDLSANAINCAQQRLGSKSKLIEWRVEDIMNFVPARQYDLWHDRAVLHFLTDNHDREQYVQVLKAAVKPGGHVIIAAFAIGGPTQCSGLDIVQYDAKRLMVLLDRNFKLIEEKMEQHITPAGKEQLFGYYVLIKL